MSRRSKIEQKLVEEIPQASALARAERIRRVRNMANLTRLQMCEGVDININTLKGWEIGRYGGVTSYGAEKIIHRIALEGVHCSIDWLMYGIGAGPSIKTGFTAFNLPAETTPQKKDEESKIAAELALLKTHYEKVIDFIIPDSAMQPFYFEGDYVAGIELSKQHYNCAIGKLCIVQMADGEIAVRELRPGLELHYSLRCTNPDLNILQPILYDVPIICLAPIIWHRQKSHFTLL
jgi:transcriptional regulator with XRE-family HTH domain